MGLGSVRDDGVLPRRRGCRPSSAPPPHPRIWRQGCHGQALRLPVHSGAASLSPGIVSAGGTLPFMKRWLVRIVLCFVLGAITTVAVAWGCAFYVKQSAYFGPDASMTAWFRAGTYHIARTAARPGWRGVVLEEKDAATREEFEDWTSDLTGSESADFDPSLPLPNWSTASAVRGSESLYVGGPIFDDAYGWPCLAMRARVVVRGMWTPLESIVVEHAIQLDGIDSGTIHIRRRLLPLKPIAVGFLSNTLLFGGAWFVLFWVGASYTHVVRMWLRERRGRCIRCGYDLRGNLDLGCPECGWGRTEHGHD